MSSPPATRTGLGSAVAARARRVLRSPLVGMFAGSHGVDGYLAPWQPRLSLHDATAEVVSVRHQNDRSTTFGLRANAAWGGFRAGQFVPVGFEIKGVRRTRNLSPAGSQYDERTLEFTATTRPGGLVTSFVQNELRVGADVHLGAAQGTFTLPEVRPERLLLVSGGSGITPVLSMLRTLCAEGHRGEIRFVHYARTAAESLYRREVEALAEVNDNVDASFVATREGGSHASVGTLGDARGSLVAVSGPDSLRDAVLEACSPTADAVLVESFELPSVAIDDVPADGTVHFVRSGRAAPAEACTLLQQAEAVGLTPAYGCRMGICHTCTTRLVDGTVRNLLTGEICDERDREIQLCVSVAHGHVALEL